MKKYLFIIILAAISMSAGAQTVGDAFYVYQNNGNFNAFMRGEVDSITYSNIGIDSVEYNDIVMQIIYTKDSVYKIPLEDIDSVAFVTPKTIVNKDVFPLTSAHDQYIIKGDTISFSMRLTAPDNMRPKKGNIVVSEYDCTSFPYGIIARVTSIDKTDSSYNYNCESASLDDVYDQIVAYHDGMSYQDSQDTASSAKGPMRAEGSLTKILWDKTFNKTIEYSGTSTNLNVNDKAYIKLTLRKTLTTPLYACFEIQNGLSSSIDFSAKTENDYYKSFTITPTLTLGRIVIPDFPLIWIQPKLGLNGYFEEQGKIELNYTGHFNRTDKVVMVYNEGKWSFSYTPSTSAGTDVSNISMTGHSEVGLIPDLFFSLCGSGTGFGLRASAGLKESMDFLFDATKLKDGGMYEANKTSYCRTTIPYSVEVYANAHLLDNHSEITATASVTYSKEQQWGTDKYILPEFSTPLYERGVSSDMAGISTVVSRDIIVPAKVGMRLYDSNGNLFSEQSSSSASNSYKNEKTTTLFTGLKENQEYTAHPTVTIFGYTMEATPTLKFKVNETIGVTTGTASSITMTGATLSGSATGANNAKDTVCIGIVYNTSGSPSVDDGITVASGNTTNGDFSVTLSGLTENATYYFCSYIAIDGKYYYGNVLSFTTKKKSDDLTPGEAIDLGLSVKWASCNVGASSPEGYGGYYAWGETEENSDYDDSTYKYYDSSTDKYIDIGSNISGTQYDVAHVKWGGNWRMPTHEEFQELCNKCTSTWTTYNGVSGYKFVGPNGNSIFLPAAGSRWGTDVYSQGSNGCYWTGTICSYKSDIAWRLNFDLANLIPGYNNRILGFSRSEEHTSELQSPDHLVCRLL